VRPKARETTLIADATIALPLVACYAITNRKRALSL
jgi:deoxyhypusine synthase